MRITASTHDCMTAFLCIIILLYCISVSDEVVMPAGEIGPTYICRCKQIKSTRTQVFDQEECIPPTLCSPRPQALKALSRYIGTPIRKVRPPGRNRCGLDIRIPIVPMIFLSRTCSERATRACGGLEEQLLIWGANCGRPSEPGGVVFPTYVDVLYPRIKVCEIMICLVIYLKNLSLIIMHSSQDYLSWLRNRNKEVGLFTSHIKKQKFRQNTEFSEWVRGGLKDEGGKPAIYILRVNCWNRLFTVLEMTRKL